MSHDNTGLMVKWQYMTHQPWRISTRSSSRARKARPIRILAEYLEPLRRFKEQKIQDTVVFFGSARVDSRERAERALATLQRTRRQRVPTSSMRPSSRKIAQGASSGRATTRTRASWPGC